MRLSSSVPPTVPSDNHGIRLRGPRHEEKQIRGPFCLLAPSSKEVFLELLFVSLQAVSGDRTEVTFASQEDASRAQPLEAQNGPSTIFTGSGLVSGLNVSLVTCPQSLKQISGFLLN